MAIEVTVDAQDPYLENGDRSREEAVESPKIAHANPIRVYTLVLNAKRRFRALPKNRLEAKRLPSSGRMSIDGMLLKSAYQSFEKTRDKDVPQVQVARQEGFKNTDAVFLAELTQGSDKHRLQSFGSGVGIAQSLEVDPKIGINTGEIKRWRRAFGANSLRVKKQRGFWSFVWDAMQDFTLGILAMCAVISLVLGLSTGGQGSEGLYDGVGIIFSILLVIFVTALSDYQQSLEFANLNEEKKKVFINVTRDGRRQKVLTFDLVVGDIIHLEVGDQIPTDGIILISNKLVVDESSLTGESKPARKDSREKPFLFAGTMVSEGYGTMIVTAVGMNTEWGHAMSMVETGVEEQTPLQVELDGLVTSIGKIGAVVAIVVLVFGIVRYIRMQSNGIFDYSTAQWLDVMQLFAVAVTIVVVAVPEGLPLAVTLTLAYSMMRMVKERALVRHLSACETMGSATTICSDKTGTLTTNKMSVVDVWLCGKSCVNIQSCKDELCQDSRDLILEGIFLNTSGDVHQPQEGRASSEDKVIGSPTEAAILKFGMDMGGRFKELRSACQLLTVEPFSSEKKKMGAAVKSPGGGVRVHWKGASEAMLQMSDSIHMPDGGVIDLDDSRRTTLTDVIDKMTRKSLRTIGLAYKCVDPQLAPERPDSPGAEDWEIPSKGLTLLAILGLQDPPRPGVLEAVKVCEKAGICVRMITGDNLGTAVAIAEQCGIWAPGDMCIEGPVFRQWSKEHQRDSVADIKVMARSSPTDKLTFVKLLKERGEVVAVTGDGTNDAPALYEADIGLAMGIVGTEVAKESADVIILDDNFVTIVNVAKWGRSVYANIQKFIQFQLTVNLVALALNFISSMITGVAPLTTVQLLWVNLIMDTLGALALATEHPTDDLMDKPATGRNKQIITSVMWTNIGAQAVLQLIVLVALLFRGKQVLREIFGISNVSDVELNTVLFNIFVLFQLFNQVNSRSIDKIWVFQGLFENPIFLCIMAFTISMQILMVQALGKFASTTPLSLRLWGLCIVTAFMSVPVGVLTKLCTQYWTTKTPLSASSHSNPASGSNDYRPLPGEPEGSSKVASKV